jgi:hypothetical protein
MDKGQKKALEEFNELLNKAAKLLFEAIESELGEGVRWRHAVFDARSESGDAIVSTFQVELEDKTVKYIADIPKARIATFKAWRVKDSAFPDKWYGIRITLTPDGECNTVFNYDPECVNEPGFCSLDD